MKLIYSLLIMIICISLIAIIGCQWTLDNPSDSHAQEYTVRSEASLSVESKSPYYKNDTISVWGGIRSMPVEKSGLVNQYRWDFGNDGIVDTILNKTGVVKIPLPKTGKYSVSLQLTDALGYISSTNVTITVLPKMKLDTIPIDTISPPLSLIHISEPTRRS
jgi:hypothetical protein